MYLIEASLSTIVKKQLIYKINSYSGFFISLITFQIMALMFSFNGVWSSGTRDNFIYLSVKTYAGDFIIFFTMIWVFIVAITISKKNSLNYDFSFISNRLSSNLSNIVFILLISFVGGLTAIFAGILQRVILYFSIDHAHIAAENFLIPFNELLASVFITFLYLMLIGSIGYLFGILVNLFKPFVIIIPAFIIISIVFGVVGSIDHGGGIIEVRNIFTFFIKEDSIILFSLKVIITMAISFCLSILLSNKMEVR